MNTWKTLTVSELEVGKKLLVQDGNHGNDRPRPDEFVAEGVAFVRAADLGSGRVNFAQAARINDRAVARVRKGHGLPGDSLLSHKGTVGKVARVESSAPQFVCSPQTTFWRSLDINFIDPIFLYFFLQSPQLVAQLEAQKGETDMAPYVSLTQQRGLRVTVPPIEEQCAIADVLGALDDKIAANTKLASAADQFLRTLIECSGGSETIRVGELFSSRREAANPEVIDPETPYVGLEHVPRRSIWLGESGTASEVNSGKSRFAEGDVLFGKLRPYFHKVVTAPFAGICSTDILVLRPNDRALAGFATVAVASDAVVAAVTSSSEGTRMPRASWKDLAAVEVAWPGHEAAAALSAHIDDIRRSILIVLAENRTLAAIRDALLPQLMSGKLRVRDLEGAQS